MLEAMRSVRAGIKVSWNGFLSLTLALISSIIFLNVGLLDELVEASLSTAEAQLTCVPCEIFITAVLYSRLFCDLIHCLMNLIRESSFFSGYMFRVRSASSFLTLVVVAMAAAQSEGPRSYNSCTTISFSNLILIF